MMTLRGEARVKKSVVITQQSRALPVSCVDDDTVGGKGKRVKK
jgi:hypothetical protein